MTKLTVAQQEYEGYINRRFKKLLDKYGVRFKLVPVTLRSRRVKQQ